MFVSRHGGKVVFVNEVKRDGGGPKSAEMMRTVLAVATVVKSCLVVEEGNDHKFRGKRTTLCPIVQDGM